MLATIMQALDTTIANVALPHMQGALQSSQDQISWVLTSYIVAAAIATPLTGWLCSALGRRRVFLIAVAGFTVASALCGMADNILEIVAARLLQGLFGAALVPLSQAVLLDINPKEKIGQAMAIWGAGIMIGPILGPMLGGWLTENASWRWVFYINLPVGVLAFYGIARYLPESRPGGIKLDIFGFVTLSLTIGLLQMFLDRGEQLDWFDSTEIKLEAIGCLIAFAFFVAHTFTAIGTSFFDRRLLKDRNFVTGLLFAFIVGLVLYATMALLPTLLQGLLGYPVVYTGMTMAPRGIGTMVAMLMVGRLLHFIDARAIMALGLHAHGHRAVHDDRHDAGHEQPHHHHLGHHPGAGHRLHVRAAQRGGLRHARARTAQRRHAHLQPAAQHRLQRRHLHRAGDAHLGHGARARGARHRHHRRQPGLPEPARRGEPGDVHGPRRAQRPGRSPGRDDGLPRRLPLHAGADRGRRCRCCC